MECDKEERPGTELKDTRNRRRRRKKSVDFTDDISPPDRTVEVGTHASRTP